MKTLSLLGILAALLLTCSCEKKLAMAPPPPPPPSILDNESYQEQSLFKGDQAILSDQDIDRILSTRLVLADRHRLAVLNLGSSTWWSEDISDLESKNTQNLLNALKNSSQLTEVRVLPSMLVPQKRTVPYLREAAARVQADLLLVYVTRIQTFRRDRLLKPGEVRAQCVAESVLLDVRTGIVAHTAFATENISLMRTSSDLNFDETVARAETDARGKALLSIANTVVTRLSEGGK